jgi:hypothetical protein
VAPTLYEPRDAIADATGHDKARADVA